MYRTDMLHRQMEMTFAEIQFLIRLLYSSQDTYSYQITLNQLWNKVVHLHSLYSILYSQMMATTPQQLPLPPTPTWQVDQQSTNPMYPQGTTAPPTERNFTREELSLYTGMNGNPAYVAVNGVVYDVTNNAAWSAASHFGLLAGRDLTQQFASCHAGENWILETLVPVGRLIE